MIQEESEIIREPQDLRVLSTPPEACQLRPIEDWDDWRRRWQAATEFEARESLIYRGYDIYLGCIGRTDKFYEPLDRHLQYLVIADGWNTGHAGIELAEDKEITFYFGSDNLGNPQRKSPGQLRQMLAVSAWKKLCTNFFSTIELGPNNYSFFPLWEDEIVSEKFFPSLRHFFRVENSKGGGVRVCNLSASKEKSHEENQVVKFLLNLARFMWHWREQGDRIEKEDEVQRRLIKLRSRIETAKPWMIEVLFYLRKLDLLYDWLLQLDATCIAKLEEIALRTKLSKFEHHVKEDRLVKDLYEACFANSRAAVLLQQYQVRSKVSSKLRRIRDAEIAVERAHREMEELDRMGR